MRSGKNPLPASGVSGVSRCQSVSCICKYKFTHLNKWLNSKQFSHLREDLALHLKQDEGARIAIETAQIE